MLVLRRTTGQQIIIAGTIRITILKVQGEHVKVGIEAPTEINILRGELTPVKERLEDVPATERNAETIEGCSTPLPR
jgi:carbon storage regulator